jgi:hypothetical protein
VPQEGEIGDYAARNRPVEDPDKRVPHPDPTGDWARGGRGGDGGSRGHDQSTLFWTTAPVTGLKYTSARLPSLVWA